MTDSTSINIDSLYSRIDKLDQKLSTIINQTNYNEIYIAIGILAVIMIIVIICYFNWVLSKYKHKLLADFMGELIEEDAEKRAKLINEFIKYIGLNKQKFPDIKSPTEK